MKILCTGAAGMIGGYLVDSLLQDGHEVVAADILQPEEWQQVHPAATNYAGCDLRDPLACKRIMRGVDQVYSLAFAMGGIGFIESNRFDCIESSSILSHTLRAAIDAGVSRVFVSGSACAYSHDHQTDPNGSALAEWMIQPVKPERGYGTAKWFDEEQCWAAHDQYGIECRVARYHNIYSGGPTTWTGGKEKAPAAACRKVALAKLTGNHQIDIWGDGTATRSFCWIGDCIYGTKLLMDSSYRFPLNIGSDELISVEDLHLMVEGIAGIECEHVHDMTAAQGVRGRNSDNSLCREVLDWAPSTPLLDGMTHLYGWVEDQVVRELWKG